MTRTVISFFVSVPVLSEQIVVTAPSVSTEESFLTTTFLPASTDAPSARAIVIVVGSHSGTAAIAIETAYMRLSTKAPAPSRYIDIMNMIIQIPSVSLATNFPIFLSSFWSGDSTFLVSTASRAISPNRVALPVLVIS